MSFSNSKYITLADKEGPIFTGGIITNSEPWMIPYSNTPDARNFRVNGRGISIRDGFSQFGSDFGASDYPRGIDAYYRATPSNNRIVVRYNVDGTHKLVTVHPDTGAQTSISTAGLIASDNRMNFVNGNDVIYCMNGSDLIGKLNGTTYTNPIATYKPSFGTQFANSMWISGDAQSPNTLYKSATNNFESFSGSGNDIFTAQFPITSLATSGQTLYVFTENTVDMFNNNTIRQVGSSLVYTSTPLEAREGAMNYNTTAVFGKDCYYLSKSLKIKKIAPGTNLMYDVIEVSHRANRGINSIMDSLDADQSAGFCYVIPEQSLIKWHLKSNGSNINDICIIYNVEYDEFMVDTQKIFYGGVNYKTINYTISQVEPKIYLDEYGYTDDDAPIQFYYTTKHITLGEPTMNKELWQTRTFMGVNTNTIGLKQLIYSEGNVVDTFTLEDADVPNISGGIGTEAIGTFAIGTEGADLNNDTLENISVVREKGDLQVRGKYFQAKWSCGTLAARLLLQQFSPRMEMLDQLTTSTR